MSTRSCPRSGARSDSLPGVSPDFVSSLLRTSARIEKEIDTRSLAILRIRLCTRTGTSLLSTTRSGPRSEWLVVLECSWGGVALGGAFGAVFERSSGVLERSWGVLKRSWGRLGVMLGRLGTALKVLGRLGRLLSRLGAVLEPSFLEPSSGILGPS